MCATTKKKGKSIFRIFFARSQEMCHHRGLVRFLFLKYFFTTSQTMPTTPLRWIIHDHIVLVHVGCSYGGQRRRNKKSSCHILVAWVSWRHALHHVPFIDIQLGSKIFSALANEIGRFSGWRGNHPVPHPVPHHVKRLKSSPTLRPRLPPLQPSPHLCRHFDGDYFYQKPIFAGKKWIDIFIFGETCEFGTTHWNPWWQTTTWIEPIKMTQKTHMFLSSNDGSLFWGLSIPKFTIFWEVMVNWTIRRILFSPLSNDDPGRKSSIFVRWFLFQQIKLCSKKILVLLGLVQMVLHSWYRYHSFWSPKMSGRVFDFVGKPFPKSQTCLWTCFPTKPNKRIWLLNLPHGL